jgi:YkoY family integral membrane protein
MLHQTFQPRDLILVLMLVLLEGLLSIDNALVLGLLARRVPEKLQTKALTYGLVGSFIFRLFATLGAAWLLKWPWVKLLGGGYLLYVATKHFILPTHTTEKTGDQKMNHPTFWSAVIAIELTDIAFAIDSILAGIALVGPIPQNATSWIHPKLWVIFIGGMLGVVMMRVAAAGFMLLLKKFPRFEATAYLLVLIVGLKLIVDFGLNRSVQRINFESPSAAGFWIFWLAMLLCVSAGFIPRLNSARKKL